MKIKEYQLRLASYAMLLGLVLVFYTYYDHPYNEFKMDIFLFCLALSPFLLGIRIPPLFSFFIVGSVFLHVIAHIYNWYYTFYPFFDKLMHFEAGITFCFIAFALLVLFDYRDKRGDWSKLALIVMAMILTMSGGLLKEFEEYYNSDPSYIPSPPNYNSLWDSLWDLTSDLGGMLIAAVLLISSYVAYKRVLSKNRLF